MGAALLSLGVAKTARPFPLCSPSSGPRLIDFFGRPSNKHSRARVLARSAADAQACSLHHRRVGPGRQSSPSSCRNERRLPFSSRTRRWRDFPFFMYHNSLKQAAPPMLYFHLAPQKSSSPNPKTLARRSSSGFTSPTTHRWISLVVELRCTVGTFPTPFPLCLALRRPMIHHQTS
jgi:hypothetical protein